MKQREVKDSGNITWQCVQAFSGINSKSAEEAEKIVQDNGKVTVVCTPSGGAQTVRLQLDPSWSDTVADEALIQAIEKNR